MIKSKLFLFFTLLFFATGLTRCANISGTPQGGPKDTLPPVMVKAIPAINTTNARPKRVTIEFDEYIQLKDLQKEFFTSPFMNTKPIAILKGRSVVVDIKANLDSNTTYVLNFGKSIIDNNEGNPYTGLKYVFSTGAVVDSLYMTGFISDAKTTDTIPDSYVMFFDPKADTMALDSVIFKSKALAVGRTYPNGVFIHSNLKAMDYKVYAMQDNNLNQRYDPGVDLIAFSDSLYNPANMPAFNMWYDTTKMYHIAEPQMFMSAFRENPDRRQTLSSFTRPDAQKLIMKFSSKNPQIEKFSLRGVDSSKIVIEQTRETNDSTIYWIKDVALPDTLIGDITYMRHDSVGVLYSHSQELKFVYTKPFEKEKSKRELEKEAEADTLPKASTLKFSLTSTNPMATDDFVSLKFDLLPKLFNSNKIEITNTDIKNITRKIPFTVSRDTMKIREYMIKAAFKDNEKYNIVIPSGAIKSIKDEMNDTIRYEFSIADIEKFSTLILNLNNADSTYKYSIEILEETSDKVIRRLDHLTGGRYNVQYITPGKVRIRVFEDRNGNGRWDTGELTKRIQPEKTAMFVQANGMAEVITKANWEITVDMDMHEIFKEKVHVTSENTHNHEEE